MRWLLIRRRGKAARSSWKYSSTMKAIIIRGNPTRRPITVLEFYALVCLPNWSGKMYEMIAQTRRLVLIGSICKNFSLTVALTGKDVLGEWKKNTIDAAAKPLMGKFI